jgi:hypothetical protein
VQDIVDPKIQHLLACFPTEPAEVSQAVRIQPGNALHPSAREMVQREWDLVRRRGRGAPVTAPHITRLATGLLTPRFFHKPVTFYIPPNTLMLFRNVDLYEVRHDMTWNAPWARVGTFMSFGEMRAVMRPLEEALEAVKRKAEIPGDEELLIWIEIGLDCDLAQYFSP